ncbi:Aminopeptidase M1 [Camellia lanceoleosa]|uniref:Aminopeptidase M1 n=1 Tax=Camellia lanceoleosa TaxID=1840588 RepID=A0ACC0GE03_9ERIC|nr:Aminopeptidase M1 [Camellia lanceoleosa]
MAQRAEELSLFVIDEGDNETLLSHRISSDDIYRKQNDETYHSVNKETTVDGIKVRAYCPVGKSDQGRLALDVAVKALDIYKKYGAMENYGLITYRESELLYDNLYSTAVNKQRVAIVVTHEVAHQWFGNLVTMEWWTHLWLNEGFATWVSYLVTDTLFLEWEIWTKFLEDTAGGLHLDALETSHPIEVEIHHARSIDEVADDI